MEKGSTQNAGCSTSHAILVVVSSFALMSTGCRDAGERSSEPVTATTMVNFAHLDHLGEAAGPGGEARIVHIYAEAPTYDWVGDSDEGVACVDDAARAAVVYLRAYELSGDGAALEKGKALIRFVLDMQAENGLFYNFVWNTNLDINTAHQNSRADDLEWWTSRAVWALGVAARVLRDADPDFSKAAAEAVGRTMPHIDGLLARYGQTIVVGGRTMPTWLVRQTAADATSELLLGLAALQKAYPDARLADTIRKLAEGVAMMQWGDVDTFPFGAHGSWLEGWHAWGNSQTQALSEIGMTDSGIREARNFYSRLLVTGWIHSFRYDDPDSIREFEQIAYGVRGVAVGLVRLYEATSDEDYLVMAGLAASWFTGNNVGGFEMYDPATGRGYDGIVAPDAMNRNAGAESTIEALYTILEVERYDRSRKWMFAIGRPPVSEDLDGRRRVSRTFVVDDDSVAIVLNLNERKLDIVPGPDLPKLIGR